ncbi:MAG: transporter substrate-binding domain-containing protein [Nanoarchaeota archaeon]
MKPWLFIFLFVLPMVSATAITVGVKPAEPFIIVYESGAISGFSADLIEHLTSRFDAPVEITYHVDPDIQKHLSSVKEGAVDVGIAATTITSEREAVVDFSHPIFQSSLGIAAKKDNKNMFNVLLTKEVFAIASVILIYIIICSHIMWLIERGHERFSKNYLKGIGRGMWWTIVTISTVGYGDISPKRPLGRIFGVMVIFSGIIIFGIAIAGLTSSFTVNQLSSQIRGPQDLVGQKVAVIAGTATVPIAEDWGMKLNEVADLDQAFKLLEEDKVVAVTHDTPLLQYYLRTHQKDALVLAPETYAPSTYGMTFPKGSGWRKPFNIALIGSIEDGSYDKIKKKWFG